MSDAGFAAITSIDYSASVIAEMRAKTENQSGLAWEVMDVTAMTYTDGSWPVVVDKGTIDAMLCSSDGDADGRAIIKEALRVLAFGGAFFVVSHLDPTSPDGTVVVCMQYYTWFTVSKC